MNNLKKFKLNHLILRTQFADWLYLRTGTKLNTEAGEKLFRWFSQGKLIAIKTKENYE